MSEYYKPIVKILMLKGQKGEGINEIKKSGISGLKDNYTITLTDGTTSTFSVTNGKGISSISKTGTSELVDTYTIKFNDGTTSTFTVTNGEKGDKGEKGDTGDTGQPTDEQTNSAVSSWLNEHPEATTTVQNGTITESKIYPDFLLHIKNEYVTPEMFGAKGDGVTDDTKAITDMFKYVKKEPKKIILGKNKTYILRSGLEIGKICILEGNNATILIDRIDDFTKIGNYRNQLFMDNGYDGEINIFHWTNVNMILTPQLITNGLVDGTNDISIRQYMIFGFGKCKEFHMDNCNISLTGDEKNQIVLFKFRGSGKIFINNCNFRVEHRGIYGSVIWIQSSRKGDKYYARIKDSYLYDTCRDELISIFSPFGNDVVVENCTLEKRFYPSYYTDKNTDELVDYTHFMLVDEHGENSNTIIGIDDHITTFKNCNIICKPIDSNQSKSNMFFIGGNNNNMTYDFFKFYDCNIELQKIQSIGYGGYNDKMSTALELEDYSKLFFNSCNIKISDIIGKYGFFYPKFWNTYFTNCFIECQSQLMNSFYQFGTEGSTPFTMCMNGNRLRIKNYSKDNALISLNKIAKNNFCLVDNEFIVTDENGNEITPILYKYVDNDTEYGYSSDTVKLYDTAKYRFYSKGNRMNYKSIETTEIIEGKSDTGT